MALPRRLRSLLFAPSVRPDLARKAPRTGADAVVIDLEDSTAPSAKAEGRRILAEVAAELAPQLPVLARVNDPATPWHEDDLRALPAGLAGIVVPKVESLEGLDALQERLDALEIGSPALIAGLETALGAADARGLLAHPVVDGAYFGAEDFVADMGGVRTPDNAEVAYARSRVALAGRLAGVPVLDQIVADFGDDARCRRECLEARAMGFAGKLCIHPAQVAIANDVFTPSAAEAERARRLLDAYETAKEQGLASISFEGRMVDEPVAVQARRLLELAD